MKCENIQIELSEFFDTELNDENSQIIKEHIDECELCKREFESFKRIQKQVASFAPSLNSDFDLKLQKRISEANDKSVFSKAIPIAASIALIIPLVSYLTFQPPTAVQQQFIFELESIGKTTSNDDDDFHEWTQLDDPNENLECSGSISGSYCSFNLSYFPYFPYFPES